ncbi:related to pisatin demethylase (cytochrome P450) [Phialocephala subalpina]|uniref:Cytochrome P450 monooxygenase ABA1 n=1 Tax=Phialocephala subalpina TaxID=576137 RepID=A0A1L7XJ81_9HELO|nr:related to pisatin demethylase (cytochrome P450) [Phialocephala subalpina]
MDLLARIRDQSVGSWISTILVSLVGVYVVQTFRSWYRLRHFKGPWLAGISRLWLVRKISGGRFHLDFMEVNQKYGSIARIGPNDLVTSDPAVMRRMLAVRSPYRRSEWYVGMRFDPTRDNIESVMDDDRHTKLRSIMAAGYSGKENEDLEGTVDRNIQALIKLIRTKYLSTDAKSKPLDFGRKAQYFTLDVISDVSYREPFGFLEADADLHDYIKEAEKVLPAALMVTIFPVLNWVLQLSILKAALPSEKDPLGMGKIIGITKEVVAERFRENKKVQRDMLGSFIAHGLNQEDAESETLLQVMAGSDTTAGGIRGIFLYILMHPRVMSKLRAEISSSTISSPIQEAEAKKMPYLQAIIKEGLRIFPPLVGLMSKAVPPEGDVINGLFVPGGTKIGYGSYGIFRDKNAWGQDADVFRPERWIEESPGRLKEMESTLELVFSYGKYQCLGKNIAMMELNKVFVELLRNFDFNIVNPFEPLKLECHGVFMFSEMWLTAFEREKT